MVNVFYTGMVVRLVEDIQDGRRDMSVGQLLGSVSPVLLPLIGAGILAGLGIGLGLVFCIIPGVILLTIWAVIAPVIVVERTGVMDSFGRSTALVRPNFWQTLGAIIVMALIYFVIAALFGAIGVAIGDELGSAIFRALAGALTAPLVALAATVIYFELRSVEGAGAPAAPQAAPPGAQAPTGPESPAAPAAPQQQPPQAPPPQAPPPRDPPPPPAPG